MVLIILIIKKEEFDILILGIKIPGYEKDYFALLEQVKSQFPGLAVIIFTSLDKYWEGALARGADYAISRNANLAELRETIDKISEKKLARGQP